MNSTQHEEAVGKLYRQRDADSKRLSFINAELSDAAGCLKTVATQIEALLSNRQSEVQPAIAKVDIHRILKLLAEHAQLQRHIGEANGELRRLGVQSS